VVLTPQFLVLNQLQTPIRLYDIHRELQLSLASNDIQPFHPNANVPLKKRHHVVCTIDDSKVDLKTYRRRSILTRCRSGEIALDGIHAIDLYVPRVGTQKDHQGHHHHQSHDQSHDPLHVTIDTAKSHSSSDSTYTIIMHHASAGAAFLCRSSHS
jgi:hypothetical protein